MREHIDRPKPDYRAIVRMNDIDGVRCEVFLPNDQRDSLQLYLRSDRKYDQWPIQFSVKGEVTGFDGKPELRIEADTVYFKDGCTTYWSKDEPDTVIVGDPLNLTITRYFRGSTTDKASGNVHGYFTIQPSTAINVKKSLQISYTGDIKARKTTEFAITLYPDIELVFESYYKYPEDTGDNVVGIPELIARFDVHPDSFNKLVEFKEIDDLLALVSFANKQRCMCTGWFASHPSTETSYFRNDVVPCQSSRDRSHYEKLIDQANFQPFVKTAYAKMIGLDVERRSLLRRAIDCAIHKRDETLESFFISLYSGIESLVIYHKKEYPLSNTIFCRSEWKDFEKGYKALVEKTFPGDEGTKIFQRKQKLLHKLGSINSHPMGNAFGRMLIDYQVDLSDLWPLYETDTKHKDLSWIRNQLVHGRVFERTQASALVAAGEHLRWTLERLLLSILGWPAEKSHASKDFLAHIMANYCDLDKHRSALR